MGSTMRVAAPLQAGRGLTYVSRTVLREAAALLEGAR
jgi:hypothetical protein